MSVKSSHFCLLVKVCLALAFVAVAHDGPALGADLTVTVDGVRNDAGKVRIAIFDEATEFPRGKKLVSTNLSAGTGRVVAVVQGLAPGRYAVAVHHDENDNKEMDLGFLGVPKEGYGFSNDARVIFGPPVFDAASFNVSNDKTEIVLNLKY